MISFWLNMRINKGFLRFLTNTIPRPDVVGLGFRINYDN